MSHFNLLFVIFISALCSCCKGPVGTEPAIVKSDVPNTVRLFPDNPRYLQYKGEPVLLVTSAEHYGAVVNMDFDYITYLDQLTKEGFNYTRIFSGMYIEPVENVFGIQNNTLAPLPGRFLSPWVKVDGKYDLDQFNSAFFERMKNIVGKAEQLGIIVEVTLFTSIYAENAWELSPFHGDNNINGVGNVEYKRVNTLFNEGLRPYQEQFIRRVVKELNEFENIFFEIQNEPWSDNANLSDLVNQDDGAVFNRAWQKKVEVANNLSLDWQAWVASVIADEESNLTNKHLVAQNISNFVYDQQDLPDHVSIINFHYALPEAALINLHIGGVVGLDETGFMPHDDLLYLNQAWRFILSGGGLYNNLDYSFTVGNESGDWPIPESNPGWGGPEFRKKLSYLAKTIRQVPFWEMEVNTSILKSEDQKMKQYGLALPGEVYLVFIEEYTGAALVPVVPAASYEVTWLNVDTGKKHTRKSQLGDGKSIEPDFREDQAVLLIRKTDQP